MMSIQTQQKIYDRYSEDYNKSSFKQLFKRKTATNLDFDSNNKSIIACMKRTTAPQQYLFDWVNMATNNMAIPNREKQNAKLICDSYP